MAKKKKDRIDMASEITQKILDQMEAGEVPWRKPWVGGYPENLSTGRPYRGVNVLMLNLSRQLSGYDRNLWLTYNQARQSGGYVRKGERGTRIVFWKFVERKAKEDEEEETVRIPLMRSYTVFNVAQCDELEIPERGDAPEPIAEAEAIIDGYAGAPELTHDGGDRAFYRPKDDSIHMPEKSTFDSVEEYYSVVFHEEVHGTGHESRVDRETLTKLSSFKDSNYSEEELVAEFGSAFLMGMIGGGYIAKTLENSAAYIQHWMKKLGEDKRLIVRVCAAAQKGVDWVAGDRPAEAKAKVEAKVKPKAKSKSKTKAKPKVEPVPEPVSEPVAEPEPAQCTVPKFMVDAKEMRQAIKTVKPAVAAKHGGIPSLERILVEADEDGVVIHGGTPSMVVSYDLPSAKVDAPGKMPALPEVLSALIKGKKGDVVVDGAQIDGLDPADWMDVNHRDTEFTVKGLSRAMAKGINFISHEDTRHFLNGIHLTNEGGKMEAQATDGKRLKIVRLTSGRKKPVGMIIPFRACKILLGKAWDGQVPIGSTEKVATFVSDDGVKLTTRLIEGMFPDCKAITDMPIGNAATVTVAKDELVDAVAKAAAPYGKKGNKHRVQIESYGDSMVVTTAPTGGHEVDKVSVNIPASGSELVTAFDHIYITQALQSVDGETVELVMDNSGLSPAHLTGSDKDEVTILMPMRKSE